MRSLFPRAALAAAALSLLAFPAAAQVVVNETFDTYLNQGAFEAAWVPIGTTAPLSASLSTVQAVSGANSVEILGTLTGGQQRNRLTFADTTPITAAGNQVVFSFDFYDSAPTAAPYRQSVNLQDTIAPAGTAQLISLGMNNNQTAANSGGNYYMARILGATTPTIDPDGGPNESVTGAGIYFKLNDFGTGLRSLGWHNLKVVIATDDGLSTDFEFYVDNVLAERVSNVSTAASFRMYDNIALGSGLSNGGTANTVYYDNVILTTQVVPEPAAMAIVLAGLLGGLRLRNRMKRK